MSRENKSPPETQIVEVVNSKIKKLRTIPYAISEKVKLKSKMNLVNPFNYNKVDVNN